MPDRFRRARRPTVRGLQPRHLANARGSRDKSFPGSRYDGLKMRSMLRNQLGAAPFVRLLNRSGLPFLGQIAQIVIAGGAPMAG